MLKIFGRQFRTTARKCLPFEFKEDIIKDMVHLKTNIYHSRLKYKPI